MTAGTKGPRTDLEWEVWPEALYSMIMRITRDYKRPAIEVTESGCSYGDAPDAKGMVNDTRRIAYYQSYLAAGARSIQDGADVRGHHAWSCSTISSGPRDTASASDWFMWISKRRNAPSKNPANGTQS